MSSKYKVGEDAIAHFVTPHLAEVYFWLLFLAHSISKKQNFLFDYLDKYYGMLRSLENIFLIKKIQHNV